MSAPPGKRTPIRTDLEGGEPLLYKVVAICDEPTVVIAPLYERDGEDDGGGR